MKFIAFMASQQGRLLRGSLGLALIVTAILTLEGGGQIFSLLLGSVLLAVAIFDVCLFAPLFGKPLSGSKIGKRPSHSTASTLLSVAALLVITGAVLARPSDTTTQLTTAASGSQKTNILAPPDETTPEAVTANKQSQDELLLYLVEEEKLAHDVYTVMYEQYGANVFGNILKSEQNHQGQVLTLLQARSIADPRSSERGVFRNPELQALYDQLVAQGKQSTVEAYKVGVAVEEKDIADITTQLATATDNDIVATLERLRTGSENHLRAFNRQLSRY
ncbi:DUF2202 domain-containing protein [Candidatus Saccharibacteria bacterium]|nr:MAG: DUF2202 domain-containing protein [Candidatus Saccharibacteria bacterium]